MNIHLFDIVKDQERFERAPFFVLLDDRAKRCPELVVAGATPWNSRKASVQPVKGKRTVNLSTSSHTAAAHAC